MESVSAEEVVRHRETSTAAQRIALHEATIALNAKAKAIAKANPGRGKGSVSAHGELMASVAKQCAEIVWALYNAVTFDEPRAPARPYVPHYVHKRGRLEAEVERLCPGTYSQFAARNANQDPAS